jgi:hypothetical protein
MRGQVANKELLSIRMVSSLDMASNIHCFGAHLSNVCFWPKAVVPERQPSARSGQSNVATPLEMIHVKMHSGKR